MADEYLTVLLRLEGKTDQLVAALDKVEGAQKKVGEGAKKAAKEQDDWFDKTRKGLQKVRAAWGEYQGSLAVAKQAFGFLESAADSFAASNEEAGKAWKASKKEWDEGFSKIKNAIGEIVVALGPLIGALGRVAGLVGDIASKATRGATDSFISAVGGGASVRVDAHGGEGHVYSAGDGWYGYSSDKTLAMARNMAAAGAAFGVSAESSAMAQKQFGKRKTGGSGGFELQDYQDLQGRGGSYRSVGDFGPISVDYDKEYANRVAEYRKRQQGFATYDRESLLGDMRGVVPGMDEVQRFQGQLAEQLQGQRTTYLEQIFGPLDQFNAYAAGFDMLGNTVAAAYSAWVDGTSSVADAIKGTLAASLKSMGAEMAIAALKETAYGFASLAWGPIGGASAAAHFKSAGLFALGAAAAGVAAKGIGGGGGASAGGGYSGGANLGGMGGGGGAAPTNTTIIIGDYFGANPREQNGRVARAIRSARKEIRDEAGTRDE